MRLERAVIVSFSAVTYLATVRYEQSLSGVQAGVPVAGHLTSGLLPVGASVAVLVFDEHSAADRVVIGPFGSVPSAWVTSGEIVDGTIATADLADGAVTSAKIADGTIVNADVSSSAAIDVSKLGGSGTSFEPTLKGGVTAGSFVYALRTGRYVQIGPVVVYTFTVNVSSVSSSPSGNAQVSMPVNSSSQSNLYGACALEVSNIGFSSGFTYATGRISPGSNVVELFQNGSGVSITPLNSASIAAGYQVLGTVVYLAG